MNVLLSGSTACENEIDECEGIRPHTPPVLTATDTHYQNHCQTVLFQYHFRF